MYNIVLIMTSGLVMDRSHANGYPDFSGGILGVFLLSMIFAVCFCLAAFIKLRKFFFVLSMLRVFIMKVY